MEYLLVVTRTLLGFFAVSMLTGSAASACTSSFMDMDVLVKRAERITNNYVESRELDRELRVVPDWNFNCSGNITGLLLGVDIRTGETEYPEVQTWRRNGNQFTKVDSRTIVLSPGNFSASGVFQYHLTTPLPVVAGDMIGVYQPNEGSSVVRIYYKTNDPDAPESYIVANQGQSPTTFSVSTPNPVQEYILLSVITDIPQCASNFLTFEAFKQKVLEANIYDVVKREGQLRIFPDISFACSGNLTKWIIAGEAGYDGAELQIWRRNNVGQNNYSLVGSSVLPVSSNSFVDVYNHTPNPPLEFQEGDILGVYQHSGSEHVKVYYQKTTGPANYRHFTNMDPPLNIKVLTEPSLINQYDYPLVSVEIATTSLSSTVLISSLLPKDAVTTIKSLSSTTSSPLLPQQIPTSSVQPTATMSPGPSVNQLVVTVAVVVSFLVALSSVVVGCIILIAVLKCVKAGRVQSYPVQERVGKIDNLDNPVYEYDTVNPNLELTESQELLVSTRNRDRSILNSAMSSGQYDQVPYTDYSYARPVSRIDPRHWGIVVPTMAQRRTLTQSLGKSPHHLTEQELYASLTHEGASSYEVPQSIFGTEDNTTYWQPSNDTEGIYEQLARRRFREIFHHQIKVMKRIGSGQFGHVDQGVWQNPEGNVDVAIKTLKREASEIETVKFLQEAAIMGQFHHPNIVKLHGVVTVGEPVMIVLELMSSGDLRQYLHGLRPVPGGMVPPSLPHELLGYSRQISSGMEYLSKKSFVHRDLAARNILVSESGTCKIADFGMSRDLEDEQYYISHGGQIPIKWTAPEALHYKKYSTSSDVWSFGVLMYEIWSLGHKPFETKTNPEAFRLIQSGYRLSPPPGCPREMYHIMIQCWHPDTTGRPSFIDLVSRLSQPENQLLKWTDRDKSVTHPQSTMLGAPLETASNLHSDLQQQYM